MRVDSRTALLQALLAGEGFGLELQQRIEASTGGLTHLAQGTLYPALRELERDGLVESFEGETVPERGGRPRIYYRLTTEGRRVANEERSAAWGLFGVGGTPEPVVG